MERQRWIMSSRMDGNASLLGSFGAGSCTICWSRSRMPAGAQSPSSMASFELNGNLPIAISMILKP